MTRHKRSSSVLAVPALALTLALLLPASPAVAAPATWSPAENRSTVGVRAYAPEITAASDGSLTAIWSQGSPIVVQISRSTDGGFTWDTPTTLSTGSTASTPDIAAGTDGSVVAVWVHFDGVNNVIQSSRFDGTSWDAATTLSVSGAHATAPQVAAAPDGKFIATWQRPDGGLNGVQISNFDGAGWSTPEYLTDGTLAATAPQLAVAGTTRTVVWPTTSGMYGRIQVSTSVDDGATWSAPQFLTADLKLAYTPQLAAAPDGTFTAAWVLDNLVEVSHSTDGLTWSAGQAVGGSGAARNPQLAIAPDNTRMLVSRKSDGTDYRVQAIQSADGVTWSPPEWISPVGEAVDQPHLAATSSGDFAAVWQRDNILNTTIKASIFDGTAWGATPAILSDTAEPSELPRVTGSAGGSFATVWLTQIGSFDTAMSAFTTMAPTITSAPPPAGVVGEPYSFQVTAAGNPATTFAVTSGALPTGLSMTSAGLITGTPTATTPASFTITASNGISPDSAASYTLSPGLAPSITSGAPTVPTVGQAYSFPVTADGNPALTFSVTSGSLPAGLSMTSSGLISGTPTSADSASFTITATNGVAPDAALSYTLAPLLAPTITSAAPPEATVGVAYTFQVTADGNPAPTFAITSGSLPAGLSMTSAGLITGIPTSGGDSPFTITASNGVSPDATASYSLSPTVPATAPAGASAGAGGDGELPRSGADWKPVASLATVFLLIGAALTGALQPTPGRIRGTR